MRQIDVASATASELRHIIYGLVLPRPIAWVSTLAPNGCANLAPHSFFNAVSVAPPVVMFSSTHSSRHDPSGRKDTVRNIETGREFVINFVSEDLLAPMVATSAEVPPDVDEFDLAGLAKLPSTSVRPPRVAVAKAALECRVHGMLEIGDATAIFGEVVTAHVLEEACRDGRPDAARLRPVARLGGALYTTLGDVLEMKRPEPAEPHQP